MINIKTIYFLLLTNCKKNILSENYGTKTISLHINKIEVISKFRLFYAHMVICVLLKPKHVFGNDCMVSRLTSETDEKL